MIIRLGITGGRTATSHSITSSNYTKFVTQYNKGCVPMSTHSFYFSCFCCMFPCPVPYSKRAIKQLIHTCFPLKDIRKPVSLCYTWRLIYGFSSGLCIGVIVPEPCTVTVTESCVDCKSCIISFSYSS